MGTRELDGPRVHRRHGKTLPRVLALVDEGVALGLVGVEGAEGVA